MHLLKKTITIYVMEKGGLSWLSQDARVGVFGACLFPSTKGTAVVLTCLFLFCVRCRPFLPFSFVCAWPCNFQYNWFCWCIGAPYSARNPAMLLGFLVFGFGFRFGRYRY